MSLSAAWDGIQEGCIAVPQHGYFSNELPAPYRVIWSVDGNRHSIPFGDDILVEFDCPSPPASFRMIFRDKLPGEVTTDPLLRIDAFLGVCGSRGFGLGTSHWFGMAAFNFTTAGLGVVSPDWIHVQYHDTNEGSFGMVFYTDVPP